MLTDVTRIDRTAINAWEDDDFVAAVVATGRKKLILVALWTKVYLVFPALDAMNAGLRSILSSTPWPEPPKKPIEPGWI